MHGMRSFTNILIGGSETASIMPSVKIFQASPLGFEYPNGVFIPFKSLDLVAERVAITKALWNTNLTPDFEIATIESLRRFNTEREHAFLHISCHTVTATRENDKTEKKELHLVIENSLGGAVLWSKTQIAEWMTQRSRESKLAVVFVSACRSREIGDFFVASGVNYVVCSEEPEHDLHSTASRIFADHFYQAIATGHSVINAFDHACAAVKESQEMEQSGVDVAEQVKKFALLRKDAEKAETIKSNKDDITPFPLLPPSPPKHFFGRQKEMHQIVKALVHSEKALVGIKGCPGIGKKSSARAVGDFMVSHKLWAEVVLWLPTLMHHCNVKTDDLATDGDIKCCSQRLLGRIGGKALIMLDTKGYGKKTIERLGALVQKMIEENCQSVKVLVLYTEDTTMHAFQTAELEIVSFAELDFESGLGLFARHLNADARKAILQLGTRNVKKGLELTKQVLGNGIPAKTIFAAKNITFAQCKALLSGEPSEEVFKDLLMKVDNDYQKMLHRTVPRSQAEVQDRFGPLLEKESRVFTKSAPAYLRPAKMGEVITTVIGGKKETESKVKDDDSWVARGISGEFYVLTKPEFEERYDKDGTPIDGKDADSSIRRLRKDGFRRYEPKRQNVLAHQIKKEDMTWFRHGQDVSTDQVQATHFIAPWGDPQLVEEGDYVVSLQGKAGDGIYRIEQFTFGETYKEDSVHSGEKRHRLCSSDGNKLVADGKKWH